MTTDDTISFKKGGKVKKGSKKKKRPKNGRRRPKNGRRRPRSQPMTTLRKPSGYLGTLSADKGLEFGSGPIAMEARIARLQNLVDT